MADQNNSELARAIQDVTEKAQLLVREEIALAKAEMSEKVSKLIKGAVFGIVAARLPRLRADLPPALPRAGHLGACSGRTRTTGSATSSSGVLLILLGAIGGFIAMRFVKRGSPPTPQMAIEEAQLIKGTLTASPPGAAGRPGRRAPGARAGARGGGR